MAIKFCSALTTFALATAFAFAQTAPPASPAATTMGSPSPPVTLPLNELDRLQSAAAQASSVLGQMRIDRWKADNNTKQQAHSDAESVERNVSSALPGLISAVRAAPQDLNAAFKLYRNVGALHDVMLSLTESAGAFGNKSDFEALAQESNVIDGVRRSLGDALEQMASAQQNELDRLRNQIRVQQQQAAAAAAAPPKKTVVDDNQPAKKPSAHKKKPVAPKPAPSSDTASDSSAGSASTPKN